MLYYFHFVLENCPTFSFPNGEFEGSFAPKGRLTFSCNDGYALNGVPELTCEPSPINDDPYWNDPIPHCNSKYSSVIVIIL